jgi:hypothetical protein
LNRAWKKSIVAYLKTGLLSQLFPVGTMESHRKTQSRHPVTLPEIGPRISCGNLLYVYIYCDFKILVKLINEIFILKLIFL